MSTTSGQESPNGAGALGPWPAPSPFAYTIGTLVTDVSLYRGMQRSFVAGGFGETDCEYLAIDNTRPPQSSAYAGLNRVLDAARGRYVILCHQDVQLIGDGRAELDRRLEELERRDPAWAVAGNAGGVGPGRLALRITDPHGKDQKAGPFPIRVASLDENFFVVKRAARIGFSRDLDGFHFYGADICMAADVMGYAAYVIDFHLEHLSPGNSRSTAFAEGLEQFERKWCHACRPRWVQTTCALAAISGNAAGRLWRRAAAPRYARLARRMVRRSVRGRSGPP